MKSLLMQLVSVLCGLEVHVVPLTCKITEHLAKEDLEKTAQE